MLNAWKEPGSGRSPSKKCRHHDIGGIDPVQNKLVAKMIDNIVDLVDVKHSVMSQRFVASAPWLAYGLGRLSSASMAVIRHATSAELSARKTCIQLSYRPVRSHHAGGFPRETSGLSDPRLKLVAWHL